MEIDWYDSNLGTIKVNDIEEKLMSYGRFTSDDLAKRKDCITIFNNKEGTRMDMYHRLKKIMNVDAYGKPFNNWFPTYADYKEKLKKMGNYKFNFCPENLSILVTTQRTVFTPSYRDAYQFTSQITILPMISDKKLL